MSLTEKSIWLDISLGFIDTIDFTHSVFGGVYAVIA